MHDHCPPSFRSAWLRTTAAALAAATTIAACGSNGSRSPTTSSAQTGLAASTSSSSNSTSSTVAFSRCVRANGVPNFPDLGSNGMLIQGNGQTVSVNGVSVNAPAFLTAKAKCQKYLATRTVPSAGQQAQQIARTTNFARCMRGHGVPNFPDPKITIGTNGNGMVDLRGAELNFDSPAFKAAAKACGGGPKGP
jgi:hypothetical protein